MAFRYAAPFSHFLEGSESFDHYMPVLDKQARVCDMAPLEFFFSSADIAIEDYIPEKMEQSDTFSVRINKNNPSRKTKIGISTSVEQNIVQIS